MGTVSNNDQYLLKRHRFFFIVNLLLLSLIASACNSESNLPGRSITVEENVQSSIPRRTALTDYLNPIPATKIHLNWTSITNANDVATIINDAQGIIWTSGRGGVVRWDVESRAYTKYTSEHGLRSNYVTAIAASPDGAVWSGNYNGELLRFDGDVWKLVDIYVGQVIRTIITASDGEVWIGTNQGVTHFDGIDWQQYTVDDGLISSYIQALTIDRQGTVWAGSTGGISKFDGTEWSSKPLPVGITVFCIAVAPDNTLWFGLSDGTLLSAYKDAWNRYEFQNERGIAYDKPITSISVDPNGVVFFSNSFEIFRLNGQDLMQIKRQDDGAVLSLWSGVEGKLYYGTFYGGLSELDLDEQVLITYKTQDKLISNFVTSLAVTPNAFVWIGTNQGISAIRQDEWQNISMRDGLISDNILNIAVKEDGTVWIGTEEGLSVFDGKNWISKDSRAGLPGDRIQSIAIDRDGQVWIATENGVAKFDGNEWVTDPDLKKVITNSEVTCLVPGRNNTFWVTTSNKIAFFDGLEWISINPPISGISSCEYDPEGDELWLGSVHSGTVRLQGKNWESYASEEALANKKVQFIKADQARGIWLATSAGVEFFNDQIWENLRSSDGLGDNNVITIALGSDETIWFGMPLGGVSRLQLNKDYGLADGK